MKVSTGIKCAKIMTTLGFIEEKDWKTVKILNGNYRNQVKQKALRNAKETGKRIQQKLKNY